MGNTLIRRDIDGELFQLWDRPPVHYGKCLPTSVAWQIFDPQDLDNVSGSAVAAVNTNLAEDCYCIHYQATLDPLNLSALRTLLPVEGAFATWRAAKLAADLCRDLKLLHEEGIPQFVIHPERVGRWQDRFALLPTLAGILPTLTELPSNALGGWLHFVAPEVLRTRGMNKELLSAGDIYSLGRLVAALTLSTWEPETAADQLTLAEQRVELSTDELTKMLEEPSASDRERASLLSLLKRMCALLPEERPSLDEAVAGLDKILQSASPATRLPELIKRGENDLAA